MKSKVLASLLALLLVFGMTPSAFADEVTANNETEATSEPKESESAEENDAAESNPEIDNEAQNVSESEEQEEADDAAALESEESPVEVVAQSEEIAPLAPTSIDTVAALELAMQTANEGDILELSAAFASDLAVAPNPVTATITHGNAFTVSGIGAGSITAPLNMAHFAITNTGGAHITFKDLSLIAPAASGGVRVNGGEYTFDTCSFSIADKTAIEVVTTGAEISVVGSQFAGCATGINMGNNISAGKKITVNNSTFSDSANNAILAYKADVYVTSSTFERGKLTAIKAGDSLTVTDTLFEGNGSLGASGAMHPNQFAEMKITKCSFIDNRTIDNHGGAVWLPAGSSSIKPELLFEDCYFKGNTTSGNQLGGAMYGGNMFSHLTLTNCYFEGNQAKGKDPVDTQASNADGGAVAIRNSGVCHGSVTITGCTFYKNYAYDDGGAMLLEGGQTTDRLDTYIANCTFVENSATGAKFNGSGGAIQFYGMTSTEITHNTFYANSVASTLSFNAGGGGAVALDTGNAATEAIRPVLSNNIFIANTAKPATKGNVYITTKSDAGPGKNNGNVGYDNNEYAGYSNGENPTAKVVVENVFANKDSNGKPIMEYYGDPVGSSNNTAQHFCYVVSPLTDEMYRDGSGPYYDANIRTDVRGYPRDPYPNAGAVEIYWTKFDPDVASGGYWTAPPAGGIQSLLDGEIYYLVTDPSPDNTLTTFPRTTFDTTAPNVGLLGWVSNQPDTPGGSDFPVVQPNTSITSTKQTYTAKWINGFRVDFDLQHDGKWGTPQTNIASGACATEPAAPTRSGYDFGGWYREAGCSTAWNFTTDTVTADITLYAKWTQSQPKPTPKVTVKFVTNNNQTEPNQLVAIGGKVKQPTSIVKAGYTLAGWYTDAKFTTKWNFSTNTVKAAMTLYAKWTKHPEPKKALNVARLFGAHRYSTSFEVSTYERDAKNVDVVIVASGESYNFPDALTASAVSGLENNAPIVLTTNSSLSDDAKKAINKLKPSRIIIMGSTAAVSQNTENAIKKLPTVKKVSRIQGTDRQKTAEDVYRAYKGKLSKTAIIAVSTKFPDSLSVSSWAAHTKSPIFLTAMVGDRLTPETEKALREGGFTRLVIVGSTVVVPNSVVNQAKKATGITDSKKVIRLGGVDRYETSKLIAQWATDSARGSEALTFGNVAIATGEVHADSLTGGALQGKDKGVILLTPKATAYDKATALLTTNTHKVTEIRFFGSHYAINEHVVAKFINSLTYDSIIWKPGEHIKVPGCK